MIDGCPSQVKVDLGRLQKWLDRRKPNQASWSSGRSEDDRVEVLSGILNGMTLGTPIAMLVRNTDARPQDYSKPMNRPGHAVDLWEKKFGHSDVRGSGRASGRETVARVMAGAVAEAFVKSVLPECRVFGWVSQLGPWKAEQPERMTEWFADDFVARLPSAALSASILEGLTDAKSRGESFGGIGSFEIVGLPQGLGQPVFHKLKNDLASAMLSVGATVGCDFGGGFDSTELLGSEFHDRQNYGGLRGGISTGEPIRMRVAFKPASTLGAQATSGRHDPAILPRAIPVIEAMVWLVLADHVLWARLDRV